MVIVDQYLKQIGKDRTFLNPELPEEFGISLTGITDGIELIRKHMKENNKILIYGDVDVDGITGSVVMDLAFRTLGYNNYIVLTNERIYGNGLNQTTMDTIKANMPIGLLLTVDHASASDNYIKKLREMNVDVLVTDHHHLKDNTPPKHANVFINPQQENNDTYKYISGCATGFALMRELIKDHPNEYMYMDNMLELVAISTIGDMMDMSNDINRTITKVGMDKLNSSKLGKAFRRAMKYPNEIMSRDISFTLVPMVNSCSRVASSSIGYISLLPAKIIPKNIHYVVDYNHVPMIKNNNEYIDLPKTWDEHQSDEADVEHIMSNIEELKNLNTQRKKKQNDVMIEAVKQIDNDCPINMIIVKGGVGINGIISSQIGNKTNKPTITFIHGVETCSGSCRGIIPNFNVKDCLDWIKETDNDVFFIKDGTHVYGGHNFAAGMTVNTNKLDDFKRLFIQYMIDNKIEYTAPNLLDDPTVIDITNIPNLTEELAYIKQLEPFGNNLQPPKLKVKFELIKNFKSFPINPETKMIKFTGVINDLSIDCTMFADRDKDVEVRDAYIVGTMTYNKGPIFNIIDAIQ